jgi:hypothetical protein
MEANVTHGNRYFFESALQLYWLVRKEKEKID